LHNDENTDPFGDLSSQEISRYARHLSLPEIGIEGQSLLKASSVLCIGAGGLGSPVLLYLAAAGVGRLGIVDFDLVEESNLQRQIIHGTSSIGEKKSFSARDRLKGLNPFCEVKAYNETLDNGNIFEIIKDYEIICDCTDNFPSRYLINDACVLSKKVNVYGSIQGFQGQVTVFNLTNTSPNYRDLVPEPPPPGLLPTCAEGGVMGVLPGIIGVIQATEVIKIITGIGSILDGRLLVFDALSMNFRQLNLSHDEDAYRIKDLIDYKAFCKGFDSDFTSEDLPIESISPFELKKILNSDPSSIIVIDVRDPFENKISSLPGSKLIPLKDIQNGNAINLIKELVIEKKICVYCKSGKRSFLALKHLRSYGIEGVSLEGGIEAWHSNNLS
tara:strand:+ start:1806 stop:2966 length:1161 start_codon:yes stop_codon:yes gene_type:complete